jgi:hypothetical protein
MRPSKSPTLQLWIETLRVALEGPPCPRCGADGDAWPLDEEDGAIFVFDCHCGSRAEVANDSEYIANAYHQLMASCPVFVTPGPRRRLWENAQ